MQPNRPRPSYNHPYSTLPSDNNPPYPPNTSQSYPQNLPIHAPVPQHAPSANPSNGSNLGTSKLSSFNQPIPGTALTGTFTNVSNSYGLPPGINNSTGHPPTYKAAFSPPPTMPNNTMNQQNQQNPDIWTSQAWQELQGSAAGQLGLQFTNQALLQGQQMVSQNVGVMTWLRPLDLLLCVDPKLCD